MSANRFDWSTDDVLLSLPQGGADFVIFQKMALCVMSVAKQQMLFLDHSYSPAMALPAIAISIILSVLKFCQKEAKHGLRIGLKRFYRRAAEATGVSKSTIYRLVREKENAEFTVPKPKTTER